MAGKITDYTPLTTLSDGDLSDWSNFDEVSAYDSRSVSWADLKTNIQNQITFDNIYTQDGSIAANRTVTLGSNDLDFSLGTGNFSIGVGVGASSEDFHVGVATRFDDNVGIGSAPSTGFGLLITTAASGITAGLRIDGTASPANADDFHVRSTVVANLIQAKNDRLGFGGGVSTSFFTQFSIPSGLSGSTAGVRIDAGGNVSSGFDVFSVVDGGTTLFTVTASTKNIGIGGNASSLFASGTGVVGMLNATAAPSGTPTGGGVLYTEAGALKFKGSSGTVTIIAVA